MLILNKLRFIKLIIIKFVEKIVKNSRKIKHYNF